MMCNYFSCVIDRNMNVYWLKNSNSHDNIIDCYNLDDTKLEDRDIVRIEITPKNFLKLTRNKEDWVFKVDEPETIPRWFEEKRAECEAKCWDLWKTAVFRSVRRSWGIKNLCS